MSFIIMDRGTQSSRKGWSRAYRRLAVVEMDDNWLAVQRMREMILEGRATTTEPKQIKAGSRGLVRIIKTWEHLNRGLTARSAYHRAMVEARALCAALKAAAAHDEWTAGGGRLQRDF